MYLLHMMFQWLGDCMYKIISVGCGSQDNMNYVADLVNKDHGIITHAMTSHNGYYIFVYEVPDCGV
jgi:hypothetical protein